MTEMRKEPGMQFLSCPLSDEEKQKLAMEMADHIVEVARLDEEVAFLKKHYKEYSEPLEDRIQELAARVSTGVEERNVETEIHYDYDKALVRVIRTDTWEQIAERKMTKAEKQLPLDGADQDAA
jgi:hypothetical protein